MVFSNVDGPFFFLCVQKRPTFLTHVAFVFSCSGLGSLHLHANETRNGFIPFPFWSDLKLCDFPLVCHFTPCVFLISVSCNNLLKFSNRGGFSSGVNRMTENKQWNFYHDVLGRKNPPLKLQKVEALIQENIELIWENLELSQKWTPSARSGFSPIFNLLMRVSTLHPSIN